MSQEIRIIAVPRDPGSCRFIVDRPVYQAHSAFFSDAASADVSPLAHALFALAPVRTVLVRENEVLVSAQSQSDWKPLGKQIGGIIRAFINTGQDVVPPDLHRTIAGAADIRERIDRLFNVEVNPAIEAHGGFVELVDIQGSDILIRMGGGCQGCGMARLTLKEGIEKAIRRAVPEVGEVIDATDHAAGFKPYFPSETTAPPESSGKTPCPET